MAAHSTSTPYLGNLRVLELADERGEYCGRVLAGMGADVVKVEPPAGESTRSYGPFVADRPDRESSLYFWQYNLAKRSVVLDLDDAADQDRFRALAANVDIIIDGRAPGYLEARSLGDEDLRSVNPRLIFAKITPFGESGPWAEYEGSDLVHLALGGMMMNSGYDAMPDGTYDTPPIAPQMWHAYHVAGEMTVMGILAALSYRLRTGHGQRLSLSVHDAISKNTETDIPDWVSAAQPHYRITCSHSIIKGGSGFSSVSSLARTKDGRWLLPYGSYGWMKGFVDGWPGTLAMLERHQAAEDLTDGRYEDVDFRAHRPTTMHINDVRDKLIGKLKYEADLWREAQAEGMPWAPIRKPEENLRDEHWLTRKTFSDVEHPEHGRAFSYVTSKWLDTAYTWRSGPRPPLVGEHTDEVLAEWVVRPAADQPVPAVPKRAVPLERTSERGKPFALSGVRVLDMTWMLASAGAGRFLAAYGAEVIKVEHETRWDGMRFGIGIVPEGARAERDAAAGPIDAPSPSSPNRSFGFMEINSGKLGTSLNLKTEEGRELLRELVRQSDVLLEGFSPGTMDRMGFGYEELRKLNPNIIYVQQSGLGQVGTYGNARTYGPTAQALTGLSDMSGLPEPYQPAGIGYSYLDWFGAYNMANAVLAALYRRDTTGVACWIDASQGEVGLYLTGTAMLDHSANDRTWQRYGNRSPYKQAAPHGAFPVAGDDRWIAIAAFTDEQWTALGEVLDPTRSWSTDERFASADSRLAHQDELEDVVATATADLDGYVLMAELQERGVPAGVCQTAQDRFERDPQLQALEWTVELEQAEIGSWPVREVPGVLSESPGYIGGIYNRFGPSYAQDTEAAFSRILDLDEGEFDRLREAGVF